MHVHLKLNSSAWRLQHCIHLSCSCCYIIYMRVDVRVRMCQCMFVCQCRDLCLGYIDLALCLCYVMYVLIVCIYVYTCMYVWACVSVYCFITFFSTKSYLHVDVGLLFKIVFLVFTVLACHLKYPVQRL